MSYVKKVEYKIVPSGSYKVIRNCAKCGCKRAFANTNCFRVNANGNQLDVWLIYQCEKCKQTYNLTIYERIKPSDIEKEEYRSLLENDKALAMLYGNKKEIFVKNKAEIDLEDIDYLVLCIGEEHYEAGKGIEQQEIAASLQLSEKNLYYGEDYEQILRDNKSQLYAKELIIRNPFELKIRTEKVLAQIMQITRSKMKKLVDEGRLSSFPKYLGTKIEIHNLISQSE